VPLDSVHITNLTPKRALRNVEVDEDAGSLAEMGK